MFNIAKYELNFLREFSTFEPSLQHLTTLFWVFSQYNGAQVCVCDCTKLCVTLPIFFRYVIFKNVCVLYETNDWVCWERFLCFKLHQSTYILHPELSFPPSISNPPLSRNETLPLVWFCAFICYWLSRIPVISKDFWFLFLVRYSRNVSAVIFERIV